MNLKSYSRVPKLFVINSYDMYTTLLSLSFIFTIALSACKPSHAPEKSKTQINLEPKTPKYANQPPNVYSMLIEFDGADFKMHGALPSSGIVTSPDPDDAVADILRKEAILFSCSVMSETGQTLYKGYTKVNLLAHSFYQENNTASARILHRPAKLKSVYFNVNIPIEFSDNARKLLLQEVLVDPHTHSVLLNDTGRSKKRIRREILLKP